MSRSIRQQIEAKLIEINLKIKLNYSEKMLDEIDELCYDIIELTKIARRYLKK